METHAIDAKAWAIGKEWSPVFNHVPPWTETIPGRRDMDRAAKSIEDSDRFMMVNFPTKATMGAQVLDFAKLRCGAGKEHVMEEAVLLKGGSKAQAYHADDDKTLRCFRESLREDGSLPYHLSVLVALERDMVVVDFRGDEVKIPKYGAAVWRGDTSHAGGAHEDECLRAFFHVVHDPSERSAKDEDAGGVFAPYGPKDVLKLEDVFRVVTRLEYEELPEFMRGASPSTAKHKLMYYLGAGEEHFGDFAKENVKWFSQVCEKVRGGVEEAAPEDRVRVRVRARRAGARSKSVPQGELESLMAGRFGYAWASVARWDNNSCHLDTLFWTWCVFCTCARCRRSKRLWRRGGLRVPGKTFGSLSQSIGRTQCGRRSRGQLRCHRRHSRDRVWNAKAERRAPERGREREGGGGQTCSTPGARVAVEGVLLQPLQASG